MKTEKFVLLKDIEVKIIFKRVKNLNLKVGFDKKVVLSVPIRIREEEIVRFLKSKEEWIKNALLKFQNSDSEAFYYLGQKYELQKVNHEFRECLFKIENEFFSIYHHPGLPEKTINRYLEKHLEEKLVEVTREFFEKWEKSLNISKNSLLIKKMKGKWGYCHTKNHDICLNLELIKKDLKFIEYVVLHELCHILIPNHGPKFKNLLNTHMPNWKVIVKQYSI